MARYRTIKPEFWRSEQVVSLSIEARLLFIGMWNFCDDYGVTPASDAGLKMAVYPGDPFSKEDIRRMVDELLASDLVTEYDWEGRKYWFVTGWDRHQKPECKTGLYPRPDGNIGAKIRKKANSTNDSRTFADHSPKEKGERIRKKEKVESEKPSLPPASPSVEVILEEPKREAKPNPWFDAVREVFGLIGKTQAPRVQKVSGSMREQTPAEVEPIAEIRRRMANYTSHMKDCACTPEALAKHWALCAEWNPKVYRKMTEEERAAARAIEIAEMEAKGKKHVP